MSKLNNLLARPHYLPRPKQAEIVGAALAKLHADLSPFRKPVRARTTS